MQPEADDSPDATSLTALVASLLTRLGTLIEQHKAKDARIDELLARIGELTARIAELEAKAGAPRKTPTNSSLPPSSGQKASAAPTGSEPQKTKRQGRRGVARELCPNPDHTRDVRSERCGCGAALPADQVLVHAYDHVDIPPIKPITTRITSMAPSAPAAAAASPPRRPPTCRPAARSGPASPPSSLTCTAARWSATSGSSRSATASSA
jgi:transposase